MSFIVLQDHCKDDPRTSSASGKRDPNEQHKLLEFPMRFAGNG